MGLEKSCHIWVLALFSVKGLSKRIPTAPELPYLVNPKVD
jgi:hypothetical protein